MLSLAAFSVISLLIMCFIDQRVASNARSSTPNSTAFCILPIIPHSVHNLSIEDSFKITESGETGVASGTVVRYRCLFKYALQGPIDTYECMEDTGRWSSNAFPICEQIMCGPPPSIENGMARVERQKTYPIGTRVVYSCDEGYAILAFRESLYCNIKGQWRFGHAVSDWSNLHLDSVMKPRCIETIGLKGDDFGPTTAVKRNFDRNGTMTYRYDDGKTEFAVVIFGIAVVAGAVICGFRKGGVCRPISGGTHISSSYEFNNAFPLSVASDNRNRHRRSDRQLPVLSIPTIANYSYPSDTAMKSQTPPPRYEEAPPSYEEATRSASS